MPLSFEKSPIIVRGFSKQKGPPKKKTLPLSQERLNELVLLSIENDIVDKLDYTNLISNFTAKNVRRVMFK